jgi:serine/threonine protein kinase
VKSSNVLVYTNTIGTAENWTAKVIDFGHAVIHAENSPDITNRDQLLGTDLYRPPELAKPGATFHGNIADRTDTWCWGMLLWEVLLDGRLDITKQAMQSLRESGSVAQSALGECKAYLESHHKDEKRMFPSILHILSEALNENPLLRPSAAGLISKVRALAQHR